MSITTYAELKTAVANWLARADLTDRIPEFILMAEDRIARELHDDQTMERFIGVVFRPTVDVPASGVGGTSTAITLSPDPAATEYVWGDSYSFTFPFSQTTAGGLTIDVSGIGALGVIEYVGGAALAIGNARLRKNDKVNIMYPNGGWTLVQPGGFLLPAVATYLGIRSIHLDGDPKRLTYYPPQDFWSRAATLQTGRPRIFTQEGSNIVVAPVPDATYTARATTYRRADPMADDTDSPPLLREHSGHRGLYVYGALLEAALYTEDDTAALKWAAAFDDAVEKVGRAHRYKKYPPGSLVMRSDVHGG
jgi:hypothetical protein